MAVDKARALQDALAKIEKDFGKGSIMKLGDHQEMHVEAIATGSLALDLALGIGGIPLGITRAVGQTRGGTLNTIIQPEPPILVTAGLNDPRVSYWEPAKWVARLRALKTDQNPLLLKTDMGAGHFGASGRYEHLKETAFNYAFLLRTLKVA